MIKLFHDNSLGSFFSFSSNVASVLFSAIPIPRYEIVSFGEELLSTRLTLNISGISLLL